MASSFYEYQLLIARMWKAKHSSDVYLFLSASITPLTDSRPDLIIRNTSTEAMRFEKFELVMRGAVCYLFMLGKEFKIKYLSSKANQMALEDESGAVIEFEESER